MPHLVIQYTANLEPQLDFTALCRALASSLCALADDTGAPVFPIGGVRVLAYPAAHHAVADGGGEHGFIYFNLRLARGRSGAVHQRTGEALVAAAQAHLAPLLARRAVGLTLQVDEGPEVFDAKFGNLHALFSSPR